MALRKQTKILAITAGVTAAAATGALAARAWRAADPHVQSKTAFGPLVIYNKRVSSGEVMRMMRVGRSVQGATFHGEKRFELPFMYLRSIAGAIEQAGLASGAILCLGGGAYALPKYFVAHHPDAHVSVVEVDPSVVDAARRWFYLGDAEREFLTQQRGALELVRADAGAFLEYSDELYNVIVDDVFAGAIPNTLLVGATGAELVHRHLVPGGLYIVNVVVRQGDFTELQRAAESLAQEFAYVHIVDATDVELSDDENYLVIATDRVMEFDHEVGRL